MSGVEKEAHVTSYDCSHYFAVAMSASLSGMSTKNVVPLPSLIQKNFFELGSKNYVDFFEKQIIKIIPIIANSIPRY